MSTTRFVEMEAAKAVYSANPCENVHVRGFCKEQNAVEAHLGNRRLDLFRRIKRTCPLASTPEAGAVLGNVPKWRVEERVKMPAFTWNGRLRSVEQFLKPGLLV